MKRAFAATTRHYAGEQYVLHKLSVDYEITGIDCVIIRTFTTTTGITLAKPRLRCRQQQPKTRSTKLLAYKSGDLLVITKDSESWDDIGRSLRLFGESSQRSYLVCGYAPRASPSRCHQKWQANSSDFAELSAANTPIQVQGRIDVGCNKSTIAAFHGWTKSEDMWHRYGCQCPRFLSSAPSPTTSTAETARLDALSGGEGAAAGPAGREAPVTSSPAPSPVASTQTSRSATPVSLGSAKFRRIGRLNAQDGCLGNAMNVPIRVRRSSPHCVAPHWRDSSFREGRQICLRRRQKRDTKSASRAIS